MKIANLAQKQSNGVKNRLNHRNHVTNHGFDQSDDLNDGLNGLDYIIDKRNHLFDEHNDLGNAGRKGGGWW